MIDAFWMEWFPVIVWLLMYEFWALYHGYGYTLSESVWWLDYEMIISRKASPMPPQVKLALTMWASAIIYLVTCQLCRGNTWACLLWLNRNSNYNISFFTIGTEFALFAHFMWQRRSTYDLINDALWREWEREENE